MAAAIKGTELASTLGKDEFLKLLLTKMKYKDPLNPSADQEFLAQLAQFTAMEQMIQLNEKVEKLNASITASSRNEAQSAALNLLGMYVTANDPDKKGSTIEGLVTTITSKDGVPKITIITKDNKERVVGMEDITKVTLY